MGADFYNKDTGFGEVVYVFYYQLSQLAFIAQPFEYHVELFWSLLEPDRDEEDEKYLTKLMSQTENEYATSYVKVKMISLLLYKMNLLPRPNFEQNLLHENYLRKPHKGLEVGEKAIEFRRILNKHWIWMLMASRKGMDVMVLVDMMWAYIAPYITQEDAVIWTNIARMQEKKGERYAYMATMHKIECCSRIMDRSGLQFPRSLTDDGKFDNWKPELGD